MGKIIYILTILYIGLIPMEAITIAEDISYGRIVFILLFAASLFDISSCYKIKTTEQPHIVILFSFIFYCFISIIWSYDQDETLHRVQLLIQYMIVTVLATNVICDYKRLKWAMVAFCLGCGYIGIASLGEYQVNSAVDMSYRSEFTTGNPNENAFMINYAIIFLLIISTNLSRTKRMLNILCIIGIAIFSYFILILGSRNGIIMLATTLLFYSIPKIWKKNNLKSVLSVLILILGILYFFFALPEAVQERYLGIQDQIAENEMAGRGYIWSKIFDMLSLPDFPIIKGTGWGTFITVFSQYSGLKIGAHNFYLNLLTTTGIIGLSLVLYYLSRLFLYLKSIKIKNKSVYYLLLIIPLISMLTTNWESRKWWFIISVFIYALYRLNKTNLLPYNEA
ncbi:O-antigen ligase family protein [Alistipes provencensis]|uniref:O-antigen ligase family protein n=1 Tax=Alistipes provencensis TaxID=1816676 RepID=UPI0007ECB1A2|nr:O-antigen ligase family protein [Alistipes provencensis]